MAFSRLPVIVDTGPLFSLLVLQLLDRISPDDPRRPAVESKLSNELRAGVAARERLRTEFYRCRGVLLTTSHVVAEVGGHLRNKLTLRRVEAVRLWGDFASLLGSEGQERLVALRQLWSSDEHRNLVPTVGLTDSGLIALARQCQGEIWTQDRPLKNLADAQRPPVACRHWPNDFWS